MSPGLALKDSRGTSPAESTGFRGISFRDGHEPRLGIQDAATLWQPH